MKLLMESVVSGLQECSRVMLLEQLRRRVVVMCIIILLCDHLYTPGITELRYRVIQHGVTRITDT